MKLPDFSLKSFGEGGAETFSDQLAVGVIDDPAGGVGHQHMGRALRLAAAEMLIQHIDAVIDDQKGDRDLGQRAAVEPADDLGRRDDLPVA